MLSVRGSVMTPVSADAAAAIARGDRDGARARLKAIEARYGGLAARGLLDLDAKLR